MEEAKRLLADIERRKPGTYEINRLVSNLRTLNREIAYSEAESLGETEYISTVGKLGDPASYEWDLFGTIKSKLYTPVLEALKTLKIGESVTVEKEDYEVILTGLDPGIKIVIRKIEPRPPKNLSVSELAKQCRIPDLEERIAKHDLTLETLLKEASSDYKTLQEKLGISNIQASLLRLEGFKIYRPSPSVQDVCVPPDSRVWINSEEIDLPKVTERQCSCCSECESKALYTRLVSGVEMANPAIVSDFLSQVELNGKPVEVQGKIPVLSEYAGPSIVGIFLAICEGQHFHINPIRIWEWERGN